MFHVARQLTIASLASFLLVGCAPLSTPGPSAAPGGDEASGGNEAAGGNDEVRVGYGSQDPDHLTGAVVSVRAADIGHEVTSFEDLVQGHLAGVYVQHLADGGIALRIRGASSLLAGGEPLYVINGQIINGPEGSALLGVDPREITRIDVLKDAGATAIYGSRGANGVVLITTIRAR